MPHRARADGVEPDSQTQENHIATRWRTPAGRANKSCIERRENFCSPTLPKAWAGATTRASLRCAKVERSVAAPGLRDGADRAFPTGRRHAPPHEGSGRSPTRDAPSGHDTHADLLLATLTQRALPSTEVAFSSLRLSMLPAQRIANDRDRTRDTAGSACRGVTDALSTATSVPVRPPTAPSDKTQIVRDPVVVTACRHSPQVGRQCLRTPYARVDSQRRAPLTHALDAIIVCNHESRGWPDASSWARALGAQCPVAPRAVGLLGDVLNGSLAETGRR